MKNRNEASTAETPEQLVEQISRLMSEAEAMVAEKRPDLIFLDINMPGRDGFELLAALDPAPQVIFVTAYDEHALRAFQVNALDYVVKPIEIGRAHV